MRVFVSHSNKDKELASRVVELLRRALNLRSDDIRYTSEAGYGLPAGANIEQSLRQDVRDADVLIGLLTPNSLSSIYVIFELGARWGMNKTNIYLYAKGMTPEKLGSPLRDYHGLGLFQHCAHAQIGGRCCKMPECNRRQNIQLRVSD